jgi:FKBP-type peptidyl-prolyl cis-trans isomerase
MTTQRLEDTPLENFTALGKDRVQVLLTEDTVVGTGEEVKPGARVTVHYTGARCADGIIFQSSKDFGDPITFGLDQVIKGWTQGVPGMKVGGTRRLTIPSEMAYGSVRAAANIPANSDLVFDIELIALA